MNYWSTSLQSKRICRSSDEETLVESTPTHDQFTLLHSTSLLVVNFKPLLQSGRAKVWGQYINENESTDYRTVEGGVVIYQLIYWCIQPVPKLYRDELMTFQSQKSRNDPTLVFQHDPIFMIATCMTNITLQDCAGTYRETRPRHQHLEATVSRQAASDVCMYHHVCIHKYMHNIKPLPQ